ncbi:MAG: family 1 glycosylhydrolase [Eubacteriales bacterium]|nr:family 1 glycosylhydrolase [Eubacteriales bacterium]
MQYTFPKDFLWGAATAAAQIEGGAFEDGREPSIWDVFSRIPGKIKNGDLPDISCDSYHLYEKDIEAMKALGLKTYRFSFSWSRIIPDGTGEVNPAGIQYYKRLIAALKENGIVPNATMYHWDLPYALQIQGGFGNRDCISWFTHYAKVLLDNFGEDVDFWVTFNEPIALYVGHAYGFFAPGLKNEKYARQCLHHLLLCHGEAVKLFRTYGFSKAKIGIVVDVWKHYPDRPGNAEDEAYAVFNNEIAGYGMFLHPLFLGGYSEELNAYLEKNGMVPQMEEGDFETMRQPLDFYGLNFYNGLYDNAEEIRKKEAVLKAGGNYQDQPKQHPEAVRDVLHMLVEKYRIQIPIYITENGLPQEDGPLEEVLDDRERIAYVEQVLIAVHQAIADGIPVKGYYLWSLMDNFEWSAGFSLRYGLHYTDYQTGKRIPKKSAGWYARVIRENGFTIP